MELYGYKQYIESVNNNNIRKSTTKEKNVLISNPNGKKQKIKVKKKFKRNVRKTKIKIPELDSKTLNDKNFSSKN